MPAPRDRSTCIRWIRAAVFGACVGSTPIAKAQVTFGLEIYNEWTPAFTDVGRMLLRIEVTGNTTGKPVNFACSPTALPWGGGFWVTAQVTDPGIAATCSYADAWVGPLAPGEYPVTADVLGADGKLLWSGRASFAVAARGDKCNVDPYRNSAILLPARRSAEEVKALLATSLAYRALVGEVDPGGISTFGVHSYLFVSFPVLADPARVLEKLRRSGEFLSVEKDGLYCFSPPPADGVSTVVEYHNALLDHYFMTPDANEQRSIESGAVGPGWARTGQSFKAVTRPGCPVAREGGFHPVYRFAGAANVGPSSHFFTVDQKECAIVRDRVDWQWQFEGAPFWASETAADGGCPGNTTPVHRLYNNGKGGAPNHRFVADDALIAPMVGLGWIHEGVTMCVRGR